MSLKQGIGNAEYLNKRVPKNTKYQHVKTRLDTGCSLTKYLEKVEDMKKNYRYRNDEIFKRLKVTTFAQMILQVASVSELDSSLSECGSNTPEERLSVSELELRSLSSNSPSTERLEAGDVLTERSTLLSGKTGHVSVSSALAQLRSVISGVGEMSLEQRPEPEPSPDTGSSGPYSDCPFLLLDVRDRDCYNCCHIISAYSFPIICLSRTMNPYTKEVLQYKNAPGKIIIVYDEDERIASQAATIMCQRGFENLFMLSGGLKVLSQKFPGSLVSGTLPPQCKSSVKKSTALPACHVEAEQRWRFTADELNRVSDQLEEALVPSNNSSRMSSRVSSGSSVRSRQSSASSDSRPWK